MFESGIVYGRESAGGGDPFGGFSGYGGQGQNVHFDFSNLGLGDIALVTGFLVLASLGIESFDG